MEEHTEMIADISNSLMTHTTFYQDALQPGMKQVGNALETVGKTVNVALAPLSGLIWGYEQIEIWLKDKVSLRLQYVPLDQVQEPDVAIAVPTIEALRYWGEKRIVSEMFANLLAASMVRPFARFAHPAFVEVLRQMTSDEAKMMDYFSTTEECPILTAYISPKAGSVSTCVTYRFTNLAYKCGCSNPSQGSVYLDNLVRLGLLEYPPSVRFAGDKTNDEFEAIRLLTEVEEYFTSRGLEEKHLTPEIVCITPFGLDFLRVCVPARELSMKVRQ